MNPDENADLEQSEQEQDAQEAQTTGSNSEQIKSRKRIVLKQILPDSRINKFDYHIQAIKAYAALSPDGKKALRFTDFQGLINYHVQLVSGLNKFFEYMGLIEQEKGKAGYYRPTENALKFMNFLNWKQQTQAVEVLRPLVEKSWFWQSAKVLFVMKEKVTEDDLLTKLGVDAGADPKVHLNSLKSLIDYLVYANLIIKSDDGTYKLSGTANISNSSDNASALGQHKEQQGRPSSAVAHQQSNVSAQNSISPDLVYANSIQPIQLSFNINGDTDIEKLKEILKVIREVFGGAK